MSEKKTVLKEKSFSFAIRIVKLYKYLITDKKVFVLSKQLLRNGTSIGALIREAQRAKQTSFINLQLLKRNVMNLFTGLNFYFKPNSSHPQNTRILIIIL